MIYLDNNATTPVDPAVVEAMLPFLRQHHANPSAAYSSARLVKSAVEKAREQVAALIGAEAAEITFTSGGTESNNAVVDSARLAWPEKKRLVIGATEHPAVMEPAHRWEKESGIVTRVPVKADGIIDLDAFHRAVASNDVSLVSIMWANNETGVIAPMAEIVRIAHDAGALVHTDAVQAIGKLRIDLREVPVDYLSLSGHKFHAPKGIGAMFVSKRVRFRASMLGGGQENGRRSGTENVAGIVGLGVAAELARKHLEELDDARVTSMRDAFEAQVLNVLPETRIHGRRRSSPADDHTHRLGTTSNLCFPGVDGAGLLILLDEQGICCSAGSACHSAAAHPSPVLEAMGITAQDAASTLRFSFSRFNTTSEVIQAADAVIAAVTKLRVLKAEEEGPVVVSD